MLEFADSPVKDLTVAGLILQARLRYEEGHALVGNEVGVMNQTLLENLRNNFAAKIKKATEDAKVENATDLPAETLAAIQKEFDSYSEGYEFGARGGRDVDPVRAKAIELATGRVKAALKEKNMKISEIGQDKIKEMAEAAVDKYPDFMKKAQALVDAARAAAESLQVEL
jgi:hypothetical protein